MKKSQIGCSIAGILSSLFFLLSCSKATDNVIDLRPLYRRVEPSRFNQNWEGVGNFIEMTDGTVLFFHPTARQKLRAVLRKEISEHSDTFQIFSSLSNKSEIREMVAREHGGSLVIGHLTAKSTELDRLLIAPEWPKIYSYLESIKKCGV